ncbi:BcpO-related WXXGXW repeat protein [Chlorobium sp. BLA1]|uniref:YXWGXW repeat-containing protein n=1 Tax=Candidatus Chlorobium masyuteum TaxID=2716876 RepID=UPI0014246F1D|nr:YXWGXW repeat-containing protein [Candidatus Chlorobium masyuteum]NHQ61192.1 BcpO-related WXXGXW repeat protein [Candidatus Chlorobium masyuteum]NTU44434.1 BcpO-related WXXGXW repeat protein [Chlorobiaceae bacterium]
MKKQIWLAAGVACMLFAQPATEAKAEVSIHISAGERVPAFALDRRPSFIALPGRGFSVSVGIPYDIISFGNLYYIYQDGYWYNSPTYRGPWVIVRDHNLPYGIRRHRMDDIRRYRDIEYRRFDRRHNDNRRFDRNGRNDRYNDNRGVDRNDNRYSENRQVNGNDRNNDNRQGEGNNRNNDNRR